MTDASPAAAAEAFAPTPVAVGSTATPEARAVPAVQPDAPSTTLVQVNTIGDMATLEGFVPTMDVGTLRRLGGLGLGAHCVKNEKTGKLEIVGEIVALNGRVFCTAKTGQTYELADDALVRFAQVSHMPPTIASEIQADSREEMEQKLQAMLPAHQKDAFMVHLKGRFESVKTRSVDSTQGDYQTLGELIKDQREWTFDASREFELSGVFNAKEHVCCHETPCGLHLHALDTQQIAADDSQRFAGGHILDFKGFKGTVEIVPVKEWLVTIPGNEPAQEAGKPADPLKREFRHAVKQKELPPGVGEGNWLQFLKNRATKAQHVNAPFVLDR